MMPGVEVKNTVCFSFENGSKRPSLGVIANFAKTLDANAGDMEACYRVSDEKAVFIKFKSEESALYALSNNSTELDFQYADGKVVKVSMSPAGGNTQYVRVHDLPPEVPDTALVSVLDKYGKVKRVVREKFPAELELDIHTGVRGVFMDVKKVIPSSLHFHNRKGNIFYDGNKNICFVCKVDGHRMDTYPNRKPRKQGNGQVKEGQNLEQQVQQQNQQRSTSTTYADVVIDSVSFDGSKEAEMAEEEEVLDDTSVETDVDMDQVCYEQYGIANYKDKLAQLKAVVKDHVQRQETAMNQRRPPLVKSGSPNHSPPKKSSRKSSK